MYHEIHSKPIQHERPHFWVQSHGKHAGKPLREPIANCFTVVTRTTEERTLMFALCEMIYLSKKPMEIIRGSVIPFMTLRDYYKLLDQCKYTICEDLDHFSKKAEAMHSIRLLEHNSKQKMKLFTDMKTALARSCF